MIIFFGIFIVFIINLVIKVCFTVYFTNKHQHEYYINCNTEPKRRSADRRLQRDAEKFAYLPSFIITAIIVFVYFFG